MLKIDIALAIKINRRKIRREIKQAPLPVCASLFSWRDLVYMAVKYSTGFIFKITSVELLQTVNIVNLFHIIFAENFLHQGNCKEYLSS